MIFGVYVVGVGREGCSVIVGCLAGSWPLPTRCQQHLPPPDIGKCPPWGCGAKSLQVWTMFYTKYVKLAFCVVRPRMVVVIFWALAHNTKITASLLWTAHFLSDVQTHTRWMGERFKEQSLQSLQRLYLDLGLKLIHPPILHWEAALWC